MRAVGIVCKEDFTPVRSKVPDRRDENLRSVQKISVINAAAVFATRQPGNARKVQFKLFKSNRAAPQSEVVGKRLAIEKKRTGHDYAAALTAGIIVH